MRTTPRAGWGKRDVKNPESIADHTYRMGLMALISSDIPGETLHLLVDSLKKRKVEEKVKHLNTSARSWVEEKEVGLSCLILKLAEEIAELGENMKQTRHQKPKLLKISISLS
ncbi:unnamed protein product [Eruca vesicaria subsp. sativa]|uniref:HD domain-containing protein n=1 Tax=Eruca vesicaria subsp. sativa TaxID=29727 RepID=A0ABC8L559_ERUVS|nr:unnamed protein product [Eruca vesicaria subsp. sativa]